MILSYFMIFLSFGVLAGPKARIEVLPNPRSLEDFEHQYKGCPENSECDQVMGLQMSRWQELISKLNGSEVEAAKKPQYMELFRSKYGIPVEFYTEQKSQLGFKPLLFDSACKNHNLKGATKVLRGMAFLKGLTKDKAIVWRDQTQIEVPVGDILIPQPVYLFTEKGQKEFALPIGDQPLFIKDKSLFVLKEDNDFFYMIKVSPEGEWSVVNADMSRLSEWEEYRSYTTCPKSDLKADPKVFGDSFCKTIWDDDQKKKVIVKLHQGCST